ncbi:MAG: hypothetical protein LBL39_06915 [Planctomycetaceae bacterium]|nr:hypothetical protein [Planctomycetaceae bacterium]
MKKIFCVVQCLGFLELAGQFWYCLELLVLVVLSANLNLAKLFLGSIWNWFRQVLACYSAVSLLL